MRAAVHAARVFETEVTIAGAEETGCLLAPARCEGGMG
jgi:hypothetical protein